MKKRSVATRILAWMLALAMVWQSAGMETLASSASGGEVQTSLEETGANGTDSAPSETEEVPGQDAADGQESGAGSLEDGQESGAPESQTDGHKDADGAQNTDAADGGLTDEADPDGEELPENEQSADTGDAQESRTERTVIRLSGVSASGAQTALKEWSDSERSGGHPLELAAQYVSSQASGEYASYAVELLSDLEAEWYSAPQADFAAYTLYLNGHTLTLTGVEGSGGELSLNIDGAGAEESEAQGTLALEVSGDTQLAVDAGTDGISWERLAVTAVGDGSAALTLKTATSGGALLWDQVEYAEDGTENSPALKLTAGGSVSVRGESRLALSELKVEENCAFSTEGEIDASAIGNAGSLTAGGAVTAETVTLDGGSASVLLQAETLDVSGNLTVDNVAAETSGPTIRLTGGGTFSHIVSHASPAEENADASPFLTVETVKSAEEESWPVVTVSGDVDTSVSGRKIMFQRKLLTGDDETEADYADGDTVLSLGEGWTEELQNEGTDPFVYFTLSQIYERGANMRLALEESGRVTARAVEQDLTKSYWISRANDDSSYTYLNGADTLSEAKELILSDPRANSGAKYEIAVNGEELKTGSTIDFGENDLNYEEINSQVTLRLGARTLNAASNNAVITVSLYGAQDDAESSRLVFAKTGTLTIFAPDGVQNWDDLTVDFQGKAGKLTLGGTTRADGEMNRGDLRFGDVYGGVVWKTEKAAVTLNGQIRINGELSAASLKVSNEAYEENGETVTPSAYVANIGSVSGNLDLDGQLEVQAMNVKGTFTAMSDAKLTVAEPTDVPEDSHATVKNFTVKGSGSEMEAEESFLLCLYDTSEDAEAADAAPALTITGTVAKSGKMSTPALLSRVSAQGGESYTSENEGQTLISIPGQSTAVSGYFEARAVEGPYHAVWTAKKGVRLVRAFVKVTQESTGTEKTYDTLEEAVRGVSTAVSSNGFGNAKGEYTFAFSEDLRIGNANVTIPACVTALTLRGSGSMTALDLNGRTLTTSATEIFVDHDMDLQNGTLSAGSATDLTVERSFGEADPAAEAPDQDGGETSNAGNAEQSFGEGLTVNAVSASFYAELVIPRETDGTADEDSLQIDMGSAQLKVASFDAGCRDEAGESLDGIAYPSASVGTLTLNNGRSRVTGSLRAETITLQGGSLYIGQEAFLKAGTLTATKAGSRDAADGYRTVNNDGGNVEIGTLNMTAGTLYNGPCYQEDGSSSASVRVQTARRVKNLINDSDAGFYVQSFTQANGDTTVLRDGSVFAVMDKDPLTEDAAYESAGSATLYGLKVSGSPVIEKSMAAALNLYGTPADEDTGSVCVIRIPADDFVENYELQLDRLLTQEVFQVNNTSSFPLELFDAAVSLSANEENPDGAVEIPELLLYQDSRTVRLGEAVFSLSQTGVNDERPIGKYATWQQVYTAINNQNDTTADYRIDVHKDSVSVGGSFTMPTRAKSLYFSYEGTEDLCTLTWYGNLSLNTDVTFRNFWLTPQKSAKEPSVAGSLALNKKTMELAHSGGVFASVSGSTGSVLDIYADPDTELPAGGADTTYESAEAWMTVTGAVSGVAGLLLSGQGRSADGQAIPTLRATGNIAATNVTMYQEETSGAAWLASVNGKIALTNVVTDGQGNRITYKGANANSMLTISGTVSSGSDDSMAYREDGSRLYYRTNAVTVEQTEPGASYIKADGTRTLLTANKAQASWFVTEDEGGTRQYTIKSGSAILSTAAGSAPAVELGVLTGDTGADGDETAEAHAYYATVKEAFAEINALNDKTGRYQVTILSDDTATSNTENLSFPAASKAAFLRICGGESESSEYRFKNEIRIGGHTEFKKITLVPADGQQAGVVLGNSELDLYAVDAPSVTIKEKETPAIKAVSGSGKAILRTDSPLTVSGNMTGLGELEVREPDGVTEDFTADQLSVLILGSLSAASLKLGRAPEEGERVSELSLVVGGKTTVTDVVCAHEMCILAVPLTLTVSKGLVTKATPTLTINGAVQGDALNLVLTRNVTAEEIQFMPLSDYQADEALSGGADYGTTDVLWGAAYKTGEGEDAAYSRIPVASAKKVSADRVKLLSVDDGSAMGSLYKSGGALTYMSAADYDVELSYTAEDGEASTPFLTLADAVTEINNLNDKTQDYTITLQRTIGTGEDSRTAPVTVSLPGKGKAGTVTITSEKGKTYDIYYQGNITANTDLKLERVAFHRKAKSGQNWIEQSYDAGAQKRIYVSATTLTSSCALTLGEDVSFNTPLLLRGNNAGRLYLTAEETPLKTAGNRPDSVSGGNVLYGSALSFASVSSKKALFVQKYASSENSKGVVSYAEGGLTTKEAEFSGDLTVEGKLDVTARLDLSQGEEKKTVQAGTVAVKDLALNNASVESGGTFTVSGNVTYEGGDNLLVSYRKSAKDATPYLTIKGLVTEENGSGTPNRITVKVLESVTETLEDGTKVTKTTTPYLATADESGAVAAKTRYLLNAPKASADCFRPYYEENVEGNAGRSNLTPGDGSVYTDGAKNGYILFRDGSGNVNVYYAKEVQAKVVYTPADGGDAQTLGYYAAWADAVKEVNALKSAEAGSEISIKLFRNVGGNKSESDPDSPVSLSLPSTNADVVIESGGNACIYYMEDLTLKSHVRFAGVTLAPVTAKGAGTGLSISVGKYGLELDNVNVADGSSIRDISGSGAKDARYLFRGAEAYHLTGNFAVTNGEVCVERDVELAAAGTFTLTNGTVQLMYNAALSTEKSFAASNGTVSLLGGARLTVGGDLNAATLGFVGEGSQAESAGKLTVRTLGLCGDSLVSAKAAMNITDVILPSEETEQDSVPIIRTCRTKENGNGLDSSQLTISGVICTVGADGEKTPASGGLIRLEIMENDAKKGSEEAEAPRIDAEDYRLRYDRDASVKLNVSANLKLADIKKEYLSHFVVVMKTATAAELYAAAGDLVKYNGGVYLAGYHEPVLISDDAEDVQSAGTGSDLAPYAVKLTRGGAAGETDGDAQEYSWCLDMSQTATEISNLAVPADSYVISLPETLEDTCVTDGNRWSALTLPAANKARAVTVNAQNGQAATLRFLVSGQMKPAGEVTFEDITLSPSDGKAYLLADGTYASGAANFAVALSVSTIDKVKYSSLTFDNCRILTEVKNSDLTGTVPQRAMLASVSGSGSLSRVTFKNGTDMGVKGSFANVDTLEVENASLTTLGTVRVNRARLADTAASDADKGAAAVWNAFGAVAVNTELTAQMDHAGSYIGTSQTVKSAKSNFTLNGTASASGGTWIRIKVFKDDATAAKAEEAWMKDDASGTALGALYRTGAAGDGAQAETYKDVPLLIAPKADAGVFRAAAFRYGDDGAEISGIRKENLISYKDQNYNVLNGDRTEMAVQVTRTDAGSAGAEGTYARTFSQAVAMIDKAADKSAEYTMKLLHGDEADSTAEEAVFKTAKDSRQNAVYGALTLPTYAKTVTVEGGTEDGTAAVLRYTGNLTPRCDTVLKDVRLSEGTVKDGKWTEKNPTVNLGSAKWSLTLPRQNEAYASVSATQGTVIVPKVSGGVEVAGAVNVKYLTVQGDLHMTGRLTSTELRLGGELSAEDAVTVTSLTADTAGAAVSGKKAMTFTDLLAGAEGSKLALTTWRTALTRTNKVSKTQLTVNGGIGVDTTLRLMVYEETDGEAVEFTETQIDDYALDAEGTPSDSVKLAVMPKASLAQVTLSGAEDYSLWKHEKGLYLATEEYGKENGGLPVAVTAAETDADGADAVYEASFMTWAQAVKEIDVIAKSSLAYTITLAENAGTNGSIGTLTMPAKAAKLTVRSNDDSSRCVFFTGTSVTLKCPTEFDRIGLIAVKKRTSGKLTWYESAAYSLNAGNYGLTVKNMPDGGSYAYGDGGRYEDPVEAQISKITGGSKATLTWETTTSWMDADGETHDVYGVFAKPAEQITGFGTLIFTTSGDVDTKVDGKALQIGEAYAELSVPKGISGIGTLTIGTGVTLDVSAGSVSTKDARIEGRLNTRNYTSTGTTTMSRGEIDAGIWVRNTVTGAVKLKDLVLERPDNQITGRRNKSNATQIVISGTVKTAESYNEADVSGDVTEHAPVVVGLTDYTRNDYVQLTDGMALLQAAKVTAEEADALFVPRYSRRADEESGLGEIKGMGVKPSGEAALTKPAKSNNIVWNHTEAV
ncbi:MAG: hypothetical protein Q4C82_00840 [Eubacteriales bacterium]|nr:hypothetical protein [Eubacteriales bacterium]